MIWEEGQERPLEVPPAPLFSPEAAVGHFSAEVWGGHSPAGLHSFPGHCPQLGLCLLSSKNGKKLTVLWAGKELGLQAFGLKKTFLNTCSFLSKTKMKQLRALASSPWLEQCPGVSTVQQVPLQL